MHYSESAILVGSDPDALVDLWRVVGIEGKLWPTKMAAEIAAACAFPRDTQQQSYARLSYIQYARF